MKKRAILPSPWSGLPRTRIGQKLYQIYSQILTRRFHRLYYGTPETWYRNTYFGHRIFQFPGDMLLYQELIVRLRPAFIIQTGVAYGGSILYFAHLLDQIGAGPEALAVGIDIQLSDDACRITHPRVRLIEGDSADPATARQVARLLPAVGGMVSLDSAHTYDHVRREIAIYAPFVAVGSYLVVEDTNINGHPIWSDHGPGPYEAVEEFLRADRRFERDDTIWRRNLFSFHQHGWLRRAQ